jgi:hypothetical protein
LSQKETPRRQVSGLLLGLLSNLTRVDQMTAPQPYSIQAESETENDTRGNVVQEALVQENAVQKTDQESLHRKIDGAVLDLYSDVNSLETIGGFLLDADVKCDSSAVGAIVERYTGLIQEGLGKVEELVCVMKRANDES